MPSNLILKGIGGHLVLIPAAALLLLTGCRKPEIAANWTEDPIVVDGDMQEWAGLWNTYLKDEKALLGLSNDGEKLYILLRFGERSWIYTFMTGHLTVWVDTQGRRNRDLGFRYSGGISLRDIMGGRGGSQPGMPERPPRLEVILGDPERVRQIALDGSDGPEARAGMAEGILTLELSIPLTGRTDDYFGVDVGPGDELSIGFELKLDRELLIQQLPQGGTTGRGGVPGRRGGMIGGGRMPGVGMGGGMAPGGVTAPSEQKIWIRTVLAGSEH